MNRKHFLRNVLMCILAPRIITEASKNLAPVPESKTPMTLFEQLQELMREPIVNPRTFYWIEYDQYDIHNGYSYIKTT
jgi:hypothetical protein